MDDCRYPVGLMVEGRKAKRHDDRRWTTADGRWPNAETTCQVCLNRKDNAAIQSLKRRKQRLAAQSGKSNLRDRITRLNSFKIQKQIRGFLLPALTFFALLFSVKSFCRTTTIIYWLTSPYYKTPFRSKQHIPH